MKKLVWFLGILGLFTLFSKGYRKNLQSKRIITRKGDSPLAPEKCPHFTITSAAFGPGQQIPQVYARDGHNVSPPLEINGLPHLTQSLALILDDPDAPMPTPFVHWLLWNIPTGTRFMKSGEVPLGAVQGKNSLNKLDYSGACPPNGTHHYRFKLYALDTVLDLPEGSEKPALEEAMTGHILAQSQLIGLYKANPVTQEKLAKDMAENLLPQ